MRLSTVNHRRDLHGISVLMVEDNWLLASEAKRALEESGAIVLGPHGSQYSALRQIAGLLPSCAILDLKLQDGLSIPIALALKSRQIPMVFLTAYGRDLVPMELRDVTVLGKPVSFRQLVHEVAELVHR